MSRIIRITECRRCPNALISYMQTNTWLCTRKLLEHCPPTGTPDWCPLEQASDTADDTAAILLRTIAAEAERTGSWHVPPDLQERLRAWVAERDGGAV